MDWLMFYYIATYILALVALVSLYLSIKSSQKVSEGLRLIQDELASLTQPLFAGFGATIGAERTEVSFTNKGETAKNVSVKPGGDFSASISSDVIKDNERGLIKLSDYPWPLPEKLTLEIHYKSKVGKTGVKKLYISDLKIHAEEGN